ncbi:hypothetical protein KP509_34G020300 [Ceratopteris richardii]|nr:hypothetical protein KP509_34G020300 [Ceratopteris richardii]
MLMEPYFAQNAQAARNRQAATTEKQPEEDKSLSAYEAKLLATNRRKEAMKEAMAKQRARAAPIQKSPDVAPQSKPEAPAASVAASEEPTPTVAASDVSQAVVSKVAEPAEPPPSE